ncbi:uncharacterized protein SAPINGB_P003705 [Magnusiomyces paraingens]|uniref:BZIP domain-containing protein n=1 Tax=Magnusiomyces paraingens TaxID=2606893 RepID=A0A5E8BT06_9ASCO|nr:uncharacterized protein SAPINGB_P003705 [Saprochaete ingens]VVT53699.1 unnamed protein product [Saprochaete ingens]
MDQNYLSADFYVDLTSTSSVYSYDGLPGDLLSENNPPPLDHGVDGDDDVDIDEEEEDVENVIDNVHVRSLGSTNNNSDAQKSSVLDGVTSEQFFLNLPEIDTKSFIYDSTYFLLEPEEKSAPKFSDMNTNTPVVADPFDQQSLNNIISTHNTENNMSITTNSNSLDITAMNTQIVPAIKLESLQDHTTSPPVNNHSHTTTDSESALLEQPDLLMSLLPASQMQQTSPSPEFTKSSLKQSPNVPSIIPSPSEHELSTSASTNTSGFLPYSSHSSPALQSPPQLPLPELRSRKNSSSNVRPTINKISAPKTSSNVSSMNSYSSLSAADLTPLPTDPIHTDEERKRRNRIYAKRSRDLKNQKYKESMDKNKLMERKMDELTRENNELKLSNQRMEFKIKQLEQQLRFYGIDNGKQDLDHSCY